MTKVHNFSSRQFSELSKREKKAIKEGDVFICHTSDIIEEFNDWVIVAGVKTEDAFVPVGTFKTVAWAIWFAEGIVR